MKICITGACGILGTCLRKLPGEKLFIDRMDKHELLGKCNFHRADVVDREAMLNMLQGCQVLIHCAGSMGKQDQWDNNLSQLMRDNIEGLMSVFDAAKACNVERIIFASSNHAVGMYEVEAAPRIYESGHGVMINEDVSVRPDSFYGVTKAMGEAYGRYIAENGGPKCYVLRIGSVRSETEDHPYAYAEWGVRKGMWPRDSREYAIQEKRLKALWMSRRDFLQIVECLLTYDGPPFEVFNAVSDNDRKWLDISRAKKKLGFQPKDNSEGWVQIMTGWKRDDAGSPCFDQESSSLQVAAVVSVRLLPGDDIDLVCQLLKMTARSARDCQFVNRILLATDDKALAEAAEQFGMEAPVLRDKSLSGADIRADMVLQDFFHRLQEKDGYFPELIAPLEITYPFRPKGLLNRLIQKLVEENLNTVIAGFPEKRPVWIRRQDHLVRLDEYEKSYGAREPLHVGLASLGCITYAEMIQKGSRYGSRIGVLEINDPIAAIEIRNFADRHTFEKLRSCYESQQ